MNEAKYAKDLAESAINAMSYSSDIKFPCMSLNKQYAKRHNIEILTEELAKLGFTLVDMTLAPEPYNTVPLADKSWFIYKK